MGKQQKKWGVIYNKHGHPLNLKALVIIPLVLILFCAVGIFTNYLPTLLFILLGVIFLIAYIGVVKDYLRKKNNSSYSITDESTTNKKSK